jgi:hypothetical protein
LEFVCERGHYYEYHRSITTKFMPIEGFVNTINAVNGISWHGNLLLHYERIFN